MHSSLQRTLSAVFIGKIDFTFANHKRRKVIFYICCSFEGCPIFCNEVDRNKNLNTDICEI